MKVENLIQTIVAAVLVAMLVWMLQGCKTPKPVVQSTNTEVKTDSTSHTTTEVTTTETIKESEKGHTIEADSALAALRIHCDSLGNAYIADLEQEQGKRTNLEVELKNNKLQIKAIQEQYEVIVKGLHKEIERLEKENTQLKESKITEHTDSKQEVIEVKYIPEIVKWFAWVGAAFVVFYLVKIALWVYRKFVLKV